MANNTLRMSGLNSGLDTEAIVNALTAATKNKINTQQRSILKLQAQQEAYRTIIDKFNAFKDKYFDILNIGTCLKSKTMFNSFKSTLTSSTGTDYVPGVTVSSSSNANAASYDVTVNKVATQATYKSSTENGKAVDLSQCTDVNQEYYMKVSVGGKSTYVTFHGSTDEAEMRKEINDQLREKFGVSNKDENGVSRNLVYIDDDNKFVSADKSSVVFTSPTLYTNKRETDLTGENALETGNNSITITVGDNSKTITFSTLAEDYFDDLFETDEEGNVTNTLRSDLFKEDEEGNLVLKSEKEIGDSELAAKLSLYKQVVLNQREGEVWDRYEDWWNNLTEEDKKAFAEEVASSKYKSAMDDIDNTFEKAYDAALKQYVHNKAMGDLKPGDEGYVSYDEFFNGNEEKGIAGYEISEADEEEFKQTEEYLKLVDDTVKTKEQVEELYSGYVEAVVEKEVNAAYNEQFELAKDEAAKAAWAEKQSEEGIVLGDDNEEAYWEGYEEFKKTFAYTKEDFSAEVDGKHNEYYEAYLTKREEIENYYIDPDHMYSIDLDNMRDTQRAALFDEYLSGTYKGGVLSEEEYIQQFQGKEGFSAAREAVYQFNKSNIENNLNGVSFNLGLAEIEASYGRDGKLTVEVVNNTNIDYNPQFSITANANSTNSFGFDTTDISGTASQISTSSKLSELGLEPDANGNYNFTINGVSFSFSGDTTVSDMMKKVTASEAGVTMTYTTLTNQFILTSKEYGTGVDITFEDGGQGLMAALGFGSVSGDGVGVFTEGTNTNLTINGVEVETNSNSYTVDGTTFTFTKAAEGQTFNNEVSRDYSKAVNAIKSFVEDYNKLIEDIYGYVDDEPNSDYYFLTDDDIDEMDLSESQQNKWETMAKKGLLYRDSTITDIMSKLRTVLYNSVDAADGSKVGLYTLGITTSSDYSNHGKLVFDDTVDLEAMFEKYADEIAELFTNSETGIATQFEKIIDNAVRTTGGPGERGTLVDKAGVSGTASATSNTIYNKIKSLQEMIATLQARYEQQQDRYWKIYGNMETMLGNLNSQTSYINQLLGSY